MAQHLDHRVALNVDQGVVQHYGRWEEAAWASGELLVEPDETTIQPSPLLSRHEAQKHEEGYRWCPRRARHVPDTREGLPSPGRTNLFDLTWVHTSTVFPDVRSCLLRDDARHCWCGWWWSRFVARLSKIRTKKTNNPALDNNADFL